MDNKTRINVFGDLCLFGVDPNSFKFGDDVKALMHEAVNVGNLECPITEATTQKGYKSAHFKVPKGSLKLLEGFQVLSLANNHIADYLKEGIQDTIKHVEEKGFKWFGVGTSYDEAQKPCIIEAGGHKIAFFGASRWANISKELKIGTASENISKLKNQIKALKSQGCIVIPYFHWGYEYVRIPAPRERKIAKACIDAGADTVIGSHPHIYQGYEIYKGKPIYYSLGNAIFLSERFNNGMAPIKDDPRLFNAFFLQIIIDDNQQVEVQPIGYQLSDTGLRLLTQEEQEKQNQELEQISEILRKPYIKYWKQYYRQAVSSCDHHIYMKHRFQKIDEKKPKDKLKILMNFNSQDLRNRLAHLFRFLFK